MTLRSRDLPAIEGPEVDPAIALAPQISQPRNTGIARLCDRALHVEQEYRLRGSCPRFSYPQPTGIAGDLLPGSARAFANKIYVRVAVIGWAVTLEVIQKPRPVSGQAVFGEKCQREGEGMVDAHNRWRAIRYCSRSHLASLSLDQYLGGLRLWVGRKESIALAARLWASRRKRESVSGSTQQSPLPNNPRRCTARMMAFIPSLYAIWRNAKSVKARSLRLVRRCGAAGSPLKGNDIRLRSATIESALTNASIGCLLLLRAGKLPRPERRRPPSQVFVNFRASCAVERPVAADDALVGDFGDCQVHWDFAS